ncbi:MULTISPECIES: protease modulator HflC [Chromobacteriaceae]|uniref:Protein HflC n=3 Tax=Chromobacteriaceae TaxID=1499392 RepID=A0ABV0H3M7_9NEIS|nr:MULTISPECIES: protease modulator HflC [Chromobacteriaceae]AVG18352.1 protease modulator HflC [Chromobacterium vaccinii]ERD99515.1 membrane protein [Pseudogulbenkiania ferrooxidans EGD-HP2]MBX9297526.1 protease modulator HflC [Chromobacterium vaccinii]MBX9349597.1 protease modulator HflC [Chromobacterium vaccinii]MBX9357748.1 protease modulator HflC [Chromobacterium vaccinii]
MTERLIPTLAAVVGVLFVASLSLFTVDQRQYALVFQFGEVVKVISEPGIQFKIPLLQNVRYFDRRVQTIDAEAPELFNTREKKNVLVDSFVKWRVVDVSQFYKSVGSEAAAVARLKQTINDGLRAEFGQKTVADVISGQRDQVMETVRKRADADARKIGVEILDVRLKRVDFPDKISSSVYDRMQSERRTVASQLRSEGAADAERVRAEADKQRDVILAEAYRKAQELKGAGDAKAAAIYAEAYGKNPEFYAFWRSMDAYKESFKNKSDVMVLDPSSDFFKYLKNPQAGQGKSK